jgi:hypothetical protein
MNTHSLGRLYEYLGVWERITLLLAAEARGDEVESDKLFRTSRVRTWRLNEHMMAEHALHVLSLVYITEQLDAAACYFFALWKMDDADDPCPEDLVRVADVSAYLFTTNAEAWGRFCAELKIEPDALTAGNYRGWFLQFCESKMPDNAPSAETIRSRWMEPSTPIVTADDLLENWRDLLRQMSRHAPPPFK